MDIFEAIMMVCFGASWPVSIWKTVKVKNPIGKSVIFLWLVEMSNTTPAPSTALTKTGNIQASSATSPPSGASGI